MNTLYHGDNLDVLRREIGDESVELIYLDPPFKSDQNYHVRPRGNGSRAGGKSHAFHDTWPWNETSAAALDEVILRGDGVALVMNAFRQMIGENDLLAYLSMMAPRLIELKRVLKPTGLLYLHCDPTASHYLKLLLDAVFGAVNFRNEIIWCYRGGGVPRRDFARKHDVIFRYSKTGDYYFDVEPVRIPYSDDVLQSSPSRYDKSYRRNKVYAGYRPNPGGKHPEDWWAMQAILPSSGERLGYPTQKPQALLERIILSSTAGGDVVLDPFCGSGTTLAVAQAHGRAWIGIDANAAAIEMTGKRLQETSAAKRRQVPARGQRDVSPGIGSP